MNLLKNKMKEIYYRWVYASIGLVLGAISATAITLYVTNNIEKRINEEANEKSRPHITAAQIDSSIEAIDNELDSICASLGIDPKELKFQYREISRLEGEVSVYRDSLKTLKNENFLSDILIETLESRIRAEKRARELGIK